MKSGPLYFIAIMLLWCASSPASWIENGIQICTASGDQRTPKIAGDGIGNYFIAWDDRRNGYADIFAQKINIHGNIKWTTNGVSVCSASGEQVSPQIVVSSDGAAIIVWVDKRKGDCDIYAQKIDTAGNCVWQTGGVPVDIRSDNQYLPQLISDGMGGAIIVWEDSHYGYIYAQRIGISGSPSWNANGNLVSNYAGAARHPRIISDGSSGAIIVFQAALDIYAQRLDINGNRLWSLTGKPVCVATGVQAAPELAPDLANGAIIVWGDDRGPGLYAQRVDNSGAMLWEANGIRVNTHGNSYQLIVPDGMGGAIITAFYSASFSYGINGQRIGPSGDSYWGPNGACIRESAWSGYFPCLVQDGIGGAIIAWHGGSIETGAVEDILAQRVNANGHIQWTSDGVLACRAEGETNYPSVAADICGGAIVTWEDERAGNDDIYALRIDANGYAPPNGPDIPEGLKGTPIYNNNNVGGLFVAWDRNAESCMSHYEIYRDITETFMPGPENLLASPNDTYFYDVQWKWIPYFYYKVAAVDVIDLRSDFALLRPDDITEAKMPKPSLMNYLAQSYPNPFNPTTRISFGLEKDCVVSLRIYDAAGRLVRVLLRGNMPAGDHSAIWDGKDSAGLFASSGIYIYQLRAGNETISKKMVLVK